MNFQYWFSLAFAGALAIAVSGALAAGYPERPVEMVVAGNPGGGLDLTGRAMEAALRETKLFAQTFAIKNVGGAGGNIAHTGESEKGRWPCVVH